MSDLQKALQDYQDRRDRVTHPNGTFDRGGRWYPSDREHQDCCRSIRSPSKAWPYSLLKHCRTLVHVANLHGVSTKELCKSIEIERAAPRREGGDEYYKLVAVTEDGRYVSIYDGETEYQIGVTLKDAARQKHNGGFYVYDSPDAALGAPFPGNSQALHLPRVLLRVRAEGSYCRYKGDHWSGQPDKLAFSRITPLEVI